MMSSKPAVNWALISFRANFAQPEIVSNKEGASKSPRGIADLAQQLQNPGIRDAATGVRHQ